MYLARKPKAPKMGIREPVLRSQTHRQFVRRFSCAVKGCARLPIEAAHIRVGLPQGEHGGTSTKPNDTWIFPLCAWHHRTGGAESQHTMGERSFYTKHGIDAVAIALQLGRQSPDERIVQHAKGVRAG